MLRFQRAGTLHFKRGELLLCNDQMRSFVSLPEGCSEIWIEFSARAAKHRFEVRMANDAEWYDSDFCGRPCFVDGHLVELTPDTRQYLWHKFGLKTFYLTVWY